MKLVYRTFLYEAVSEPELLSPEPALMTLDEYITYKGFIYECLLLEVYNINDINRIFGTDIEKYLVKHMGDRFWESVPIEDTPEKNIATAKKMFIDKIFSVDPTSDKKYLGAITKWVLTKRPEDLENQVREYLLSFKKLLELNPGKFGNVSKNIAKGNFTLEQLKDLVNANSELLGKNKADLRLDNKTGDFKMIGQNESYVCYYIDKWVQDDEDKHICFNGDVDWCVKYQSNFDGYKPPYYYFLEKNTGKEFALMHVSSLQLKDIRDNPLSKDDFLLIKDIIVDILSKVEMPYSGIDYDGSDFKIIIDNVSSEEFNKIYHKIVGNLIDVALDKMDYTMLDKLFNTYEASELFQKAVAANSEAEVLNNTTWVVKDTSHRIYKLSDVTLKGLINEFGANEVAIFQEIVNVSMSRDEQSTYNRKTEIAKWMISEGYILPNEIVSRSRGESLKPLELAVSSRALGAFEELLKLPDLDPNTRGLESMHDPMGVTPLLYLANLTDYEHDMMFNLLVNDPRVDVNAFREEFDNSINDYIGSSVLDAAVEDRKKALIAKGAKTYEELDTTLKSTIKNKVTNRK